MSAENKVKYASGMHPNSRKALFEHRPKAGDPARNPKGRPTNKFSLTAIARERLADRCPEKDAKKGETWAEYLVRHWISQSKDNAVLWKELVERMDGKLTLTFGSNPDMPLVIDIGKIIAHIPGDNGNEPTSSS